MEVPTRLLRLRLAARLAARLATDTRRARDTAAPVAARHGLDVEPYDHRRLADLAARLRERRGTVLVVGHSNTTPELVRLLGGDPGAPIAHDEHDRLYRVDPASGETTLERFAAEGPAG
jgi:broad specificity phosphatase PhoE